MVKPGYKQTEIGVIPEDWDVAALCKVYDLFAGGDINASDYSPVRTKKYNYCILSNSLTNAGIYGYCSKPQFAGNSITITGRGDIGHAFCREEPFSAIIRLLVCQPKSAISSKIVAEYLETKKPFVFESTGVPQLTVPQIKDTIIPIPPLSEQWRMAEILLDMDELIASLEKLIAKKKNIKQGVMQELLTGKRRLPGYSGEWIRRKLSTYCSLITKQTGFDYSAHIKPALVRENLPETLPMIQTINFRGRKFSFDTDYFIPKAVALRFPNIILDSKCVLFSIVGASVGNLGLYPGGTSFCGGAIGITRFYNEQDADWVFYYMSSPEGQAQIDHVAKGGAQATVTIADIRNFAIPTPEKEEREAIVRILSDLDDEIICIESRLEKVRRIKQGVMRLLLMGTIRLEKQV